MYPCQRCGACCRLIGESILTRELAGAEGCCKWLDKSSNLCKRYANRPIFCNVDKYYETFLQNTMSRDAFYQLNQNACRSLRLRWKEEVNHA